MNRRVPLSKGLMDVYRSLTAPRPRPAGDNRRIPAPAGSLRPIGTRFVKVLPGCPLDARSKGHRAEYEVYGYELDAAGNPVAERVRRLSFERIEA